MKILLIGKTGQLGGDILKNGTSHEIHAPERSMLNIESKDEIEKAVKTYKPSVVINTAAFHNVPLCETEYEKAFRVNCIAVRDIALVCKKMSARFVTFSSDYVFGGEKRFPYQETDQPAPLQVYGISRVAGEYAALAAAHDITTIIRTCGLYGISGARSKGGNFVDKRIQEARGQSSLEMGCEQIVCPTYTDDLSRAVLRLIEHPRAQSGIYHLVNEGECSWHEFTKTIYEIMNIRVEVKPVDRQGMSGTMRRPLYSVLKNTNARALGITLPSWRDALVRYLKEKHK